MTEEVRIVEATGRAGGTGRDLSQKIVDAQIAAQGVMNTMGITDDTPRERLVEILGKSEVERHEKLNAAEEVEGREVNGGDVIRHSKIEARKAAKADAAARETSGE